MSARSLRSCPTLCDPLDYSPPVSSVHGILQARMREWVAMPFSRGSSPPRDRTMSPVALSGQADPQSHRSQAPPSILNVKAKSLSTGVGCHFLLQAIFPTQGSNPGLPHCRQTLYRLSHQGSPSILLKVK